MDESAAREKTLRNALADSEKRFMDLAIKYQEINAAETTWQSERRHFETACEAMKVEIDARQLKMAEMVDKITALERDNDYKRSLLSEREQWYRSEYVRKLENARLEEDKINQENRQFEIDGLRKEILRLEAELAQERVFKQETKEGKRRNGDEELMKELDELRRKLAEKVKYGKNENKLLEAEKESVLSELMVKGYAKENRRLMLGTNQLTDELRTTKEETIKRPPMIGEYELQQLRDTVKQLQDALESKEEYHRKRENANKSKLMEFEALEDEIRSLRGRTISLDKQLEEKNREITSLVRSAKENENSTKEKYDILLEDQNRLKRESQKKAEEGNRVRNENQSLKKEVKSNKEKIADLEAENNKLKDKKEVAELNSKIKSLNSTIKDLQAKTRQDQSKPALQARPATAASKARVADTSQESYRQVLTRLAGEASVPADCRQLIADIAGRLDVKAGQPKQIGRIPIASDIDILESKAVDEAEERFYGVNFDVDDYLEMEKSVSKSAKEHAREKLEVPELDQKKSLLRAVLNCLSKDNPVYQIEHEWDRIYHFVSEQGFISVKPALLDWRSKLEALDMSISQQSLVSLINRSITYFNRGDLETSKSAFDLLDTTFYSALLSNLPRLLQGVKLSTAEDNREMVIDHLRRDKAVLEDTIRQMPSDPRSVDFLVLERKIDMLEKRDKLRSMEMLDSQKKLTTGYQMCCMSA